MAATLATRGAARVRELAPGMLTSAMVAGAAAFLSEHYGAPVMLFALLLGMALNFLSDDGKCKPGIEFTARSVLRLGVALLGLRLTVAQMAALGWKPVAMVVVIVVVTIALSVLAAWLLGFNKLFGLLTGGATAICGASAALALAAALPAHQQKEKATLFTVIGVSALSTAAMIAYPMIAQLFHLSPQAAGIFLGGTIHDVAQVVGAGYSMSRETGDAATVVKLMRVAMLLPVILCAAMVARAQGTQPGEARPPLLPWFAVAFFALACINSTGIVPHALQQGGNEASRWCLVIAISALGMKTRLKELASVGIKPVALMIGETVFLAGLVLALLRWM
ncbi:putative sulfate exporter family transporter [Duganella sp. FT92W]|uniref:Putative sulfate exporter family transporter n=1 Tax=Pseudoduganella rivuli TaxID=2666085 RepID=A0A7X2II42_9BURK|nr:putative sulfate exporter family transporter [Pseudoduganella rivuli]